MSGLKLASQMKLKPNSCALAGLDARAASIVMRSVRNTVNTGRTVVCTIHQPNLTIFQVGSCTVPRVVPGRDGIYTA